MSPVGGYEAHNKWQPIQNYGWESEQVAPTSSGATFACGPPASDKLTRIYS